MRLRQRASLARLWLCALLAASPAAADCLYDTTYPYVATTSLFAAADLSALGANACKVSTSAAFNVGTATGGAIFGQVSFKVITTGFTPGAGQNLAVWLLRSYDGSTYEQSYASSCSSTVPPVQRAPDFVVPMPAVAMAANDILWSYPAQLPPGQTFKVVLWNNGGTALSAANHTVTLAAYAVKCQ